MRAGIAVAIAIALARDSAAEPMIQDQLPSEPPCAWIAPSATGRMRAERGEPRIPVPDEADRVRVVSFNVWKGQDVASIAAAIRENPALTQAKIILLQEIEDHPGEGGSRAARLAYELGMGFAYAPERPAGRGTHGSAILSRWPLENVQVMGLPIAPLYDPPEQRLALAADVRIGAAVVRVITVHLDTRISHEVRVGQLEPAVRDAPPLTIVGGDFNTLPFVSKPGDLDAYMRGIGYATPTASVPWTHVFAADRRWLMQAGIGFRSRLDSIYVRGLDTRGAGVERQVRLSDHRPIWVDVVLPR